MHKKQMKQMKITIRQEEPEDFKEVFKVIESAFEPLQFSDHKEQFLVERLRKSNAFIPELSLVAEIENKIAGHILLTYISPQINRAVKNKSYFYNCYGKEEKFYIENQG